MTYDDREREAIAAFALTVWQDPSSSPEDRAVAKQRLTSPGRVRFEITEDMAYALCSEEVTFLHKILSRWTSPENIVIPAAASVPPPTLDEHVKAACEAFVATQLAARAEGIEIDGTAVCPVCSPDTGWKAIPIVDSSNQEQSDPGISNS